MMWVKICGTTSLEDAELAANAGADAIGFVFAPHSKRRVAVAEVATISRALASRAGSRVERIGVFDALDAKRIVADAAAAGLTGLQLHGAGGLPLAGAVRTEAQAARLALTIVPVVLWEVDTVGDESLGSTHAGVSPCGGARGEGSIGDRVRAEVLALRDAGFPRILLDARLGTKVGGTGLAFPWAQAAHALARVRDNVELIVAGGLRPETVAEAIRALRPWGVDVVSGVEASPGHKGPELLRAFLAAALSS